jgi:hypothetical protein
MTQDPKIKKNVLFTRPAHTTITGAHSAFFIFVLVGIFKEMFALFSG